MKTRILTLLALCAAVLCTTGCFDIEQLIKLNADASGEAHVTMKVDMESMVKVMAGLKKSMTGEEGEPTKEELDAVRAEMLAEREQKDMKGEMEADKQRMIESLPKGVELSALELKEDGLNLEVHMAFKFDHVSKLPLIETPDEPAEEDDMGMGGPPEPNPVKKPFEGLVVKDNGDTLEITIKPSNPAEEAMPEEGEGPQMPGMDEMVKQAFSGLKFTWKIESAMEVVEHNAPTAEGGNLTWSYDLKGLEGLKGDESKSPHVVLKQSQK
ncbi:MAG: hypothetical protein KDD82_02185 [Planctomycetes bacterium]|nr:hypothetical protein [Planctomycetota bacterium]